MWGALLALISGKGSEGAGTETFETSLLRGQQAQLAEERSRRNTAIFMLVGGVVGFAGVVYLVSRK